MFRSDLYSPARTVQAPPRCIVDFYNNLIGTSLQLQSTTNFINWTTNSTFRNALNGNLVIGTNVLFRLFRAVPIP
jgi:hypothetical protein